MGPSHHELAWLLQQVVHATYRTGLASVTAVIFPGSLKSLSQDKVGKTHCSRHLEQGRYVSEAVLLGKAPGWLKKKSTSPPKDPKTQRPKEVASLSPLNPKQKNTKRLLFKRLPQTEKEKKRKPLTASRGLRGGQLGAGPVGPPGGGRAWNGCLVFGLRPPPSALLRLICFCFAFFQVVS